MRNFPKYLNNRWDYEFIRENFTPQEWRPHWRKLLDNRFIWKDVGDLPPNTEGVSDNTHRVAKNFHSPDQNAAPKQVQQELVENENAPIFQMGFSVAEVFDAIGANNT